MADDFTFTIALSCNVSRTTVNKTLKAVKAINLTWPLDSNKIILLGEGKCQMDQVAYQKG